MTVAGGWPRCERAIGHEEAHAPGSRNLQGPTLVTTSPGSSTGLFRELVDLEPLVGGEAGARFRSRRSDRPGRAASPPRAMSGI